MNAEQLLALPEDTFREIVDLEIRDQHIEGKSDESIEQMRVRRELLRDPLVLNRWYLVLVAIKKHVESQIAARKSDLRKAENQLTKAELRERVADYYRWKAGALRFKSGVEDRIMEVRSLKASVQEPGIEAIQAERNSALYEAQVLREAIKKHCEEVSRYDEPSDADQDLWKVLA